MLAAAWVFAWFVLASTAFALFQVPYIALSAELTDSSAERATLMAWRVAFLTVAILLAVATALAPFGLVAPGLALGTVAVSVGLHVFGAVTVARGGRFTYPGALPFIS